MNKPKPEDEDTRQVRHILREITRLTEAANLLEWAFSCDERAIRPNVRAAAKEALCQAQEYLDCLDVVLSEAPDLASDTQKELARLANLAQWRLEQEAGQGKPQ